PDPEGSDSASTPQALSIVQPVPALKAARLFHGPAGAAAVWTAYVRSVAKVLRLNRSWKWLDTIIALNNGLSSGTFGSEANPDSKLGLPTRSHCSPRWRKCSA